MRKIINLNENWQFIQKDMGLPNVMPTDWQTVNLGSLTPLFTTDLKHSA